MVIRWGRDAIDGWSFRLGSRTGWPQVDLEAEGSYCLLGSSFGALREGVSLWR